MGYFGPVSANSLGVVYDSTKRQLILSAKGNVEQITTNIHFQRLPWLDGLKFRLVGWSGPFTGKTNPYSVSDRFDIDLRSGALPSKFVTIVDARNLEGKIVDINYVSDPRQQGSVRQLTDVNKLAPARRDNLEPKVLVGDDEKINVLYKQAFKVKAPADAPKQGSLAIDFDPTFLDLQTAGVAGSNLVWTFNSLQLGSTQIIITTSSINPPYIARQTYDVRVILLDSSIAASMNTGNSSISYLSFLNIALRQVQEKYPSASLVLAESTAIPPSNYIDNFKSLKHFAAVFNTGQGHVTVDSTEWGTWSTPVYSSGPWLGEKIINLEKTKLEPTQADDLVKAAGWTLQSNRVYLSAPLTAPNSPLSRDQQAYYVYNLKEGIQIFVGTVDQKVYSLALLEKKDGEAS
ncbi:hypothetical protein MMC07_002738 [Pseudocyphellaria aurata]|nr:hypothetical protein [Pseudocyphellaria aurata]